MFLSFLSCSLFSYAANPRAVIVKCDGCAYDVDVYVDVFKFPMQMHREMLSARIRMYHVELSGNLILMWFSPTRSRPFCR